MAPPRGVVVVALLGVAQAAGVRVQAGAGYDTNVERREGSVHQRQADVLTQLVAELEGAVRPARRVRLAASYVGGVRTYTELHGEDALYQRVRAQLRWGAVRWLHPTLEAFVEDRLTRDPVQPRDRSRITARPGLALVFGETSVMAGVEVDRFLFKPDPVYSADGLGPQLSVRHDFGGIDASLRLERLDRTFDGPPLVQTGETEGIPQLARGSGDREDTSWAAGVSCGYHGAWLARLNLLAQRNDSNSDGSSYSSLRLEGTFTLPLPGALILSGRLALQRLDFDEPLVVALDESRTIEGDAGIVEGENRTALTARLERPFGDHVSLVLDAGAWFSPFGGGPEYGRQTLALGLAVRR